MTTKEKMMVIIKRCGCFIFVESCLDEGSQLSISAVRTDAMRPVPSEDDFANFTNSLPET